MAIFGTDIGKKASHNLHHGFGLAPGSYKKLSGKQNSTIGLISGHYTFREIDLDKDSMIELELSGGPTTVDVGNDIGFDGVEMVLLGGGVTELHFELPLTTHLSILLNQRHRTPMLPTPWKRKRKLT